ncbi:protein sidekick-1- hypothetical protein [Limosa lapponica baueri]|uniref:Uncharacterized protein n=1 Tax=Limosa lapponica baueri TaxID=1758121 RepID=A0A2I0TTW7_LIMLA|nr:protein sidekick-1- hypothetical protein [Limosa lapponica baueri]
MLQEWLLAMSIATDSDVGSGVQCLDYMINWREKKTDTLFTNLLNAFLPGGYHSSGFSMIFFLNRAITLENQLVILATSVTDAGGYYVQAVNEKNGENKTSPFIHLSVASFAFSLLSRVSSKETLVAVAWVVSRVNV